MEAYLSRFERHANSIYLNKARIQIVELGMFSAGVELLDSIRPSSLNPSERKLYYQLKKRIRVPMLQLSKLKVSGTVFKNGQLIHCAI